MQTLQPVLLYGHYAWQQDLQPVAEFESRLATVTDTMRRRTGTRSSCTATAGTMRRCAI